MPLSPSMPTPGYRDPWWIGHLFFALAVAASGAMQIFNREFVRLVPPLPAWVPQPSLLAVLLGAVLVAIGVLMVLRLRERPAAFVLLGLLVVSFVVQRVPEILSNPMTGFMWTNPLKVLALCGGALLIATAAPVATRNSLAWTQRLRPLAPLLLGVFLAVCGVQHFVYAGFVDSLVPAWIPPGARFWTVLTGVALMAGGIGVSLPRIARLAGLLSGVMIFLWLLVLHVPRAVELRSGFELAGVFEALAMSGVAFMVAGSAPRRA